MGTTVAMVQWEPQSLWCNGNHSRYGAMGTTDTTHFDACFEDSSILNIDTRRKSVASFDLRPLYPGKLSIRGRLGPRTSLNPAAVLGIEPRFYNRPTRSLFLYPLSYFASQ
jgi:hypothetical protein